MTEYSKLVRDRIPEIIAAEGRHAVVETLPAEAFRRALLAKLAEEAAELAEADDTTSYVAELADVLEVVRSLAEEAGTSLADVLAAADGKAAARGRFESRLLLVRVTEQGPGSAGPAAGG
jgi:predicted house-cleaning noncanonical NTP pyrophosphatase (MazG superfamily)